MSSKTSDQSATERLFQAFSELKTPEEARAFALDLMSTREIEDLAQRLEVARLLKEGVAYVDVTQKTGASSTTVSRVSKCLKGEGGGYRIVLERLDSAD